MLQTVTALARAIAAYLTIRANRSEVDLLFDVYDRETDMEQTILDSIASGAAPEYIGLLHGKLRVISRTRRSLEQRLERTVSRNETST